MKNLAIRVFVFAIIASQVFAAQADVADDRLRDMNALNACEDPMIAAHKPVHVIKAACHVQIEQAEWDGISWLDTYWATIVPKFHLKP